MAYAGIVLVSHSSQVVAGINDIIRQVIKEVPIELAGGTDDDAIGTSIDKIQNAISRADQGEGVLVLYDIGSAKMNAEMAIEMTEVKKAKLLEAPLLEGAYTAAVECGMGKNADEAEAAVRKEFG